jgi:hypothetical protein
MGSQRGDLGISHFHCRCLGTRHSMFTQANYLSRRNVNDSGLLGLIPCSLQDGNQRFEGLCCLHFHGWSV